MSRKPLYDSIEVTLVHESRQLSYATYNPAAEETIVLLHGAFASPWQWDIVVPHLIERNYHVLAPSFTSPHSLDTIDACREGGTASEEGGSTVLTTLLARLVATEARSGRAHVVGLSLGAQIALALASSCPALVLSLFVTGVPSVKIASALSSVAPYVVRYLPAVEGIFSAEWSIGKDVDLSCIDKEGPGENEGPSLRSARLVTTVLGGDIVRAIDRGEIGQMYGSPARNHVRRVTIVAGTGKASADSVKKAAEVGRAIERNGGGGEGGGGGGILCSVFEGKTLIHGWSRQKPAAFARCILATIDGTEMPAELTRINL